MKTIIVGDLHGRIEIAREILQLKDCNLVFIGDYLDTHEGRSVDDQIELLGLIRSSVIESDGRIKALLGNHELSYIDPSMRASGYNYKVADALRPEDFKPFIKYTWVDGYLVSHAGVSQSLLDSRRESLDAYLSAGYFPQVGGARGGIDAVGGLFWCDWWQEFVPIESTPQVVGHTAYRPDGTYEGVVSKGNSFCIDCFTNVKEVLVIDEGKASILKL